MDIPIEAYSKREEVLPPDGRHIIAHYTEKHILVYQAYNRRIGTYAVKNGYLGGEEFSLYRMSWIKPGFLWMMYRSGWAKKNQEMILGIWITRSTFDDIYRGAVHTSFQPNLYGSEAQWREALSSSDVLVQWDPDHDHAGNRLQRRALPLGLRGNTLFSFAREWIIKIEDITAFVHEQDQKRVSHHANDIIVPKERVYQPK